MKKYIKEPFPALSHLFGALLSIYALTSLLERTGDNETATIAISVYGTSLILLYFASAFTHGLHCAPNTAARLERFDHAAIFLLIAGTYTPLCLIIMNGPFGWVLLICEWLLAFFGIHTLYADKILSKTHRVVIYLVMGWMFLFALTPIVSAVSNSLLVWLLVGALLYSVGSIFFITNKPRLWPGYFDAHDLWHLFVLAGSTSHFIFMSRYLDERLI